MFSATAAPRAPVARLPWMAPATSRQAEPGLSPLRLPSMDPMNGGWYDSSMELQRGLFVQDLCVEAPDTDWLAMFDDEIVGRVV